MGIHEVASSTGLVGAGLDNMYMVPACGRALCRPLLWCVGAGSRLPRLLTLLQPFAIPDASSWIVAMLPYQSETVTDVCVVAAVVRNVVYPRPRSTWNNPYLPDLGDEQKPSCARCCAAGQTCEWDSGIRFRVSDSCSKPFAPCRWPRCPLSCACESNLTLLCSGELILFVIPYSPLR